jgi:hypothetical protein
MVGLGGERVIAADPINPLVRQFIVWVTFHVFLRITSSALYYTLLPFQQLTQFVSVHPASTFYCASITSALVCVDDGEI